jgi:hypothetical protein
LVRAPGYAAVMRHDMTRGGALRRAAAAGLAVLASACGGSEGRTAAPVAGGHAPSPGGVAVSAAGDACGHHGDAEPPGLAGITAAHNAVRCAVARPSGEPLAPLSWSSDLAAEAQRYAEQVVADNCNLKHSKTEHGENIYGGTGKPTPEHVVGRWEREKSCFRYKFPDSCSCTCGHYTQIVWSETRRVGCGKATCADGLEVWVCNYDPAGNYVGSQPY